MYNNLDSNMKEFKNLGFLNGFNIKENNKKLITENIKFENAYLINKNIIEDSIFMKFYHLIDANTAKELSRKNKNKIKLNKKSRKK